MPEREYLGSCLCGAVQFRLAGPIEVVNCCHCSRCRKRSSSAFATVVHAKLSNFRFISGEEQIRVFEPVDWNVRRFCGVCGSPLPGWSEEEDEVGVPAGLLDENFAVSPSLHIMTGSKACWYEIHDEVAQYPEFPDDW